MTNINAILRFTFFVFLSISLSPMYSQVYYSDDGRKFEVIQYNCSPDSGRNACIYLGGFGPEGTYLLGANYLIPTKFFLNLELGIYSAQFDGNIFFKSWLRDKTVRQSIAYDAGSMVKYVASVPIKKRRSLGLHLGINRFDQTYAIIPENYSTCSVFGGLSLLKSMNADWEIVGGYKRVRGIAISRLNWDLMYYFLPKYLGNNTDINGYDVVRTLGTRIYFDGKTSIWGGKHGRITINYMLGIGIQSDKSYRFTLPLGFGLGYNFL